MKGFWYPQGRSARVRARMSLVNTRFVIERDSEPDITGDFTSLVISSRVANIPRKLTLPDGSVFETPDNSQVDRWIGELSPSIGHGWLHRIESRWRWVASALALGAVFLFAGARWGLPWVSETIARQIPYSALDSMSASSLALLDRVVFEPSELPPAQQQALSDRFEQRFDQLGRQGGAGYRLHFRKLGAANALALPSGDLIATDALARMASPDEFDAVMLHEIGHVVERHGLQQLVRSSLLSFAVAMVVGDPSGANELLIALPLFVLQNTYSKAHETAADTFAFEQMVAYGIDPIHFATVMEKMDKFAPETLEQGDSAEKQTRATVPPRISHYLSSHPASEERIQRALAYSARMADESEAARLCLSGCDPDP